VITYQINVGRVINQKRILEQQQQNGFRILIQESQQMYVTPECVRLLSVTLLKIFRGQQVEGM
ncbi:hypothetical protein HDU92_005076, partial [Lobulomyces angularis]